MQPWKLFLSLEHSLFLDMEPQVMTSPCDAINPNSQSQLSCFDSLIGEVVATILEFVSIKPVVLFSTLRRTSKLFNQAVALTFERRYFLPRRVENTVSVRFSSNAAVVFRSFLVMLPMMSEACLHAVETLSLPKSVRPKEFHKLAQAFPSVKYLCFDAGIASSGAIDEIVEIVLGLLPNLETLELAEADIKPSVFPALVSKLEATVFRRLHLTGSNLWHARRDPLAFVSTYAAVFASLSWLHIESMELKDDGEFICSHFPNLEGLELVNLSLTGDFFKIWNAKASAGSGRSLVALDMTRNHFSDLPKLADVDAFFKHNAKLRSLTIEQSTFPTSWPTSVAKHCKDLRFLNFSDSLLPVTEYDALATGLVNLECVHLDLLTSDLSEERMARVSRLKSLQRLRIITSAVRAPPSFPSTVKLPNLRFLSIVADATNVQSVLSLVEGGSELRYISCGKWNEELVAAVADHCPLLESLSITGVASAAPLDLTPIFRQCKNLSSVSLLGAHYSENLFESIVRLCLRLRELSLYDIGYQLECKIQELVDHLPTSMSTLVLNSLKRIETAPTVYQSLCSSPLLDLRMIKCGNTTEASLSQWKPQLLSTFPELCICN